MKLLAGLLLSLCLAAQTRVNLQTGVYGNLPVTNLNGGTNASNTTCWRGDGQWVTCAAGSGMGTVTNTLGTLTLHGIAIGNAGADLKILSSLGTATQVLHGNAAGDPSWSAVNLADVSGNLSVANLNGGTGATSAAYWRGDGSWHSINLPTDVIGSLPVANLNGGISASGSTCWHGDATWGACGSGGGGSVTNTAGGLTLHAVVIGNAGTDLKSLSSLGTATQVLHGNAAGDPSWSAVNLADVSGNLPVGNLNGGSGASGSTCWHGDGTWGACAGGALTVKIDGTAIGSPRPIVNFVTPVGATLSSSDDGTQINITITPDPTYFVSRATAQAGLDSYCLPTSANATVYACALPKTLLAYTHGMPMRWEPDTACTGGTTTTLNIDGLGAKRIFKTDGTTNPTSTQCAAGQQLPMVYSSALNSAAGGWRILVP